MLKEELSRAPEFVQAIEEYRAKFRSKTKGHNLPEIEYLGSILSTQSVAPPTFSISLPVKNQAEQIGNILQSLFKHPDLPTEIFIFCDACEDRSEEVIAATVKREYESYARVLTIHFLRSHEDLFESTCENIAFSLSSGSYLVSMQADIYLTQDDFLERAKLCLEQNSDVFGVSGRGIVNESGHYMRKIFDRIGAISRISPLQILRRRRELVQRRLGWYLPHQSYFGSTAVRPLSKMNFSNTDLYSLFVGPTVIRGPIVWRASDFFLLGGLNDHCFFLGRDEQDLCLRGFKRIGKYVGYLPTEAHSYLWQGTSHRPRTELAEEMLRRRRNLAEEMDCESPVGQHISLPKRKIRRIQVP